VNIRRSIWRSFRARHIRIVIPTAVSDGVIARRELWKLLAPHPIILQSTVNEDNRPALPLLRRRFLAESGAGTSRRSGHDCR
jgi:hypothetical protein